MTRRTEQVASALHRAVQEVLTQGLSDPRLEGLLVTVTQVHVGDDLADATVRVSVLPDRNPSAAVHALNDAAGFIRRKAADRVDLARMPGLVFRLDKSLKKQAAVLREISDLARRRADAPETPLGGALYTNDESPAAEAGEEAR